MTDFFGEDLFSMAFADQAAFDIPDVSPSFTPFLATFPQVTFGRELEDLGLSVSADFVNQPRVAGSRHGGTFTFKVPLRGQAAGYDPSAGAPVENPEIQLLREAIGTKHVGTYLAGDVAAASDAKVWKLTAGDLIEGSAYLAELAGVLRAAGWVTDSNLVPTPNEMTMIEDAVAVPVVGDNIVPTITLYADGSQPVAKTFRVKGESDDHDLFLIGSMPESIVLELDAGKVPTAEFTYMFTDWKYKTASGDGLLTAADFDRLPPILGVHGGRVWLDGINESDTTAEPVGTCGLASLRVEITCELAAIRCHSAEQGVSELIVRRRRAAVTFGIPWTVDHITGEQSDFDTSLEEGTAQSLSIQVGDEPGQFFGLLIPQGVVSAQPALGSIEDGIVAWTIEMEPDDYAGDTGAVTAANSAFRIAFG